MNKKFIIKLFNINDYYINNKITIVIINLLLIIILITMNIKLFDNINIEYYLLNGIYISGFLNIN